MIITPSQYTGVHEEEIIQNGEDLQSFSEETYSKIAQNNNWLIDLKPVGSVLFVDINRDGAQPIDTRIWQECNGSEIVNPDSPLRSIGIDIHFIPDMRDRYLKAHSSAAGNPQLGSQDHNLQHSHATGGPSNTGSQLEDKGDRRYRVSHGHAVALQYSNPTVFDSPAYGYFVAYMKVV